MGRGGFASDIISVPYNVSLMCCFLNGMDTVHFIFFKVIKNSDIACTVDFGTAFILCFFKYLTSFNINVRQFSALTV